MVTVFCRVTAELSPAFMQTFPCQFDVNAMLSKICKDNNLDLSYQNQNLIIHGDWSSVDCAHSMLVSALAVYGSPSEMKNPHSSRPFSALVEAAEAISREVELQEQVKNAAQFMNPNLRRQDLNDSASNLQEVKSDIASIKSDDNLSNSSGVSEESYNNEPTATQHEHANLPKSEVNQDISSNDSHSTLSEEGATVEVNGQNVNYNAGNNVTSCEGNALNNSTFVADFKQGTVDGDSISKDHKVTSVLKKGKIHGVYECNICQKQYKKWKSLVVHMKFHSQVPAKQETVISYSDQGSSPNIEDKVKCQRTTSVLRKEKINSVYECDKCKNQYKKRKSLVEHMKLHTQAPEKQQTSSDYISTTVLSDAVKISSIKIEDEAQKKRFLCQKCGKSYTTKHALLQHVNFHFGIKPYQCSVCGKAFTYETALKDHRFTHNESKHFVCQYPKCEKSFRQKSVLKMHEKIHADIKQFCCSDCGRGFTQKHALQRHERSHKGHKPFKCKLCGRRFGDCSIARRHIKLVHKLNKDLGVWREDIEEVIEDQEADNQIAGEDLADIEQAQSVEVRANMVESEEDRAKIVQDQIDMDTTDKHTEMPSHASDSANNIPSVFVNYNLPEHNIVSDPSQEFQEVVPVVQHALKPFLDSTPKLDRQETIKTPTTNNLTLLQPEQETYFIERDQIHFLTENLDGTLNTSTIDFSRLKKNYEHLTKPNICLDINAVSDQFGETLKPDGTVAELPMDNSFENMSKFSDNDQLSEHLGLSLPQFQFYSSSSVNQYFNMNQSSMMPGLPNTEAASTD